MRSWIKVGLALLVAGGGCTDDGDADSNRALAAEAASARPAGPPPAPPPPPMTAADSAVAREAVAARGAALRAAFDSLRVLGAREVAELRLDRNAEQIAVARSLGIRASGAAEIERLRRQGRLVELDDSTTYWVLREMDHSVPVVTPDGRAMLIELGRRFHARLDSLGLPLYRMKVTSALRTDESQADLRRTNRNASRTVSAHEFGTTVDVSHERFAVPAPRAQPDTAHAEVQEMETEMLEELGKEKARQLQAELGRAIWALRNEGALRVMMEDAQPVYHMTVARRHTSAAP
ncbi:MAG: hypothetical protein KY464_18560 [Gemmatimonadetes bacterium]|nr:hypothetical protein [Gemmatimonadota bacterium]